MLLGQCMQEEKRGIAEAALESGTAAATRLSRQDLYRLFGIPARRNNNASNRETR